MAPHALVRNELRCPWNLYEHLAHTDVSAGGRRLERQRPAPHLRRKPDDRAFGQSNPGVRVNCAGRPWGGYPRVDLVDLQSDLETRYVSQHEQRAGAGVVELTDVKPAQEDRAGVRRDDPPTTQPGFGHL